VTDIEAIRAAQGGDAVTCLADRAQKHAAEVAEAHAKTGGAWLFRDGYGFVALSNVAAAFERHLRERQAEADPAWETRYTSEAAQGVRVRVYDGSPRCTWDSLDGAP